MVPFIPNDSLSLFCFSGLFCSLVKQVFSSISNVKCYVNIWSRLICGGRIDEVSKKCFWLFQARRRQNRASPSRTRCRTRPVVPCWANPTSTNVGRPSRPPSCRRRTTKPTSSTRTRCRSKLPRSDNLNVRSCFLLNAAAYRSSAARLFLSRVLASDEICFYMVGSQLYPATSFGIFG